ncbi:MAG: phosphotransferase [Pseudomonadota bacterium]
MAEPRRTAAREAFVASAGWDGARHLPLDGDASMRRYIRLIGPKDRRAMLMDAPPELGEDTRPFLAVTELLHAAGLSAPQVLAADPVQGFLLLEDLGDALYVREATTPARERLLYEAAVDVLAQLHRNPPAGQQRLGPYDAATYATEAALFVEWYVAGGRPEPPSADLRAEYLGHIAEATAKLAPSVLVLRDYHAENLLWLAERRGLARVGLLDYQDALIGHPAYDLVSLLEDARRDTTPELREAMQRHYLETTGAASEPFLAAYAALGAQRNLKILGIFARLARRDGKRAYLAHLPRVWQHLMRDLEHPELTALRAFVARWAPIPDAALCARLEAAS